jgi:hypothetical protein
MTRPDPRILKKLKKKLPKMSEQSIRSRLSQIRAKYNVTLNAAAQVFAQSKGFSVMRYLDKEDTESLKPIEIKKIVPFRPRKKEKILKIARFHTNNELLKAHIDEINRTYTYKCYTSTFILCRKVLENLIIGILRKKISG